MSTGTQLRDRVVALGTAAGGRVYPGRLPPKATLPAISYMRVSGVREATHSGPTGLGSPRYQLDCWAATYLAAEALGDELIVGLHARRWGAASFVENVIDGEEDAEVGLYRRIVDVTLFIQE